MSIALEPSTRAGTIAGLETCYDATEALMSSLDDADWTVRSLCPDWDVRGVIVHLAAVEYALSGWTPDPEHHPFGRIGPFETEAQAWSNAELVERTRSIFADRRTELAALSDEDFASPSVTPVGPGTYLRFMDIRVFDFWVHERDITTPLGRTTDDGGPTAVRALDEVHMSIGYIVGKRIGLPDGMSIAFRLSGPVERDILAAVDGRAAAVEALEAPSVEVYTDSLTFTQLACGRIDPQAMIDAGRISWSAGDPADEHWGETAARNLRFTM